jgi:hypothetical protein
LGPSDLAIRIDPGGEDVSTQLRQRQLIHLTFEKYFKHVPENLLLGCDRCK